MKTTMSGQIWPFIAIGLTLGGAVFAGLIGVASVARNNIDLDNPTCWV